MTSHEDALYRNPDATIEDRVDDLLQRLTVAEKVGQLTQYFYLAVAANLPPDFDLSTLDPEQQAMARQPAMVSAKAASGEVGSVLFIMDVETANTMQKRAVEESRLGIPLLFGFDVIHGMRTIFPVPIALAATWSREAITASQRVAAREARALGIHWAFAPMIDIARDPRWGRIIEGAGEDPFLGGEVAAAQVRGFQGDFGADSILAGPKHFAGYGAARGGRDYDDVDISDSELWNVYLQPFRAAIDAGAANVMSAYMDLNGVPASGNRWLLTDVLRGELGFDGFVVSDANGVKSLETQHFAADATDAAARALDAGLDMEMCMIEPAYQHLPAALDSGRESTTALDDAVRRILTAKFRLGLFENPYVDEATSAPTLADPAHRDEARRAAEESFVLLKNDGVLPLSASSIQRVAVIGSAADSKRETLGPWVFAQDTDETVTLVDGLRARLGADRVDFARGVGLPGRWAPSPFDRMDSAGGYVVEEVDDDAELEAAVAAAAAADVAIVMLAQRQNQIGEKASVSDLTFSGRQLEQLERVAATGTPVVVVVMTGRPMDLTGADERANAIMQAWYPGTRGGEALAGVLLGDVSPSGRLPFTWPRNVGQVPIIYSHYTTFQPEDQGGRYFNEPSTPLYPFGHGLSYAAFEYSNLRVDRESLAVGEEATVTVDVTNTSDIAAADVVQLYIHQRYGLSSRPVRELKGFERVVVQPGETVSVSFGLGPEQLRYWSAVTRGYVQDATVLDMWAGADSTAELSTTLDVVGEPWRGPRTA